MDRSPAPLRVVPDVLLEDEAPASTDLDHAFRRNARYVAGIAYRLLGTNEDVDDVVQDVFLSAVHGLARLRDPGAIRGWLATVTVRLCRRRLRLRRLRVWIHLDDAHDYAELAVPGTPAEDRVFLARVYRTLDAVPADQRIAWILRHVNGDDLETVARVCGCSLATAKRRIAAAHAAVEGMVSDA